MFTNHEMVLLLSTELQLEREGWARQSAPAAEPVAGPGVAERIRRRARTILHRRLAATHREPAARAGNAGTLAACAASGGPAR